MSTITPCDPHLTAAEKPRLSRQCAGILAALQRGPQSNADLARIGIRYSARIHDLRAHGYDIEIISRNHETGLVWYGLVEDQR